MTASQLARGASILALAGLAAGALWKQLVQHGNDRRNRDNFRVVQLAAERYSIADPWEAYPLTLGQLQASGLLDPWPVNPYTGRPLRQVEPGQAVSAGDVTYLSTQYELVPGFTIGDGFMVAGYGRQSKGRFSPADVHPNAERTAPPAAGLIDWSSVERLAQSGCSKPSRRYLRNQRLKDLGLPPSAD